MDVNFVRSFQTHFFACNPAIKPMVNIMAQVPEASLFVKDFESRYVYVNTVMLETYGLSRKEELIGRRNRDFLPA